MRKFLIVLLIPVLLLALLNGCKKTVSEQDQIAHYVEKENSQANKVLENGLVFLSCKYTKGDSLLTYHLKVVDNRFDKANPDSIKDNIVRDLKSPQNSKLTKMFIRSSMSLKYILDFEDKELDFIIPVSELSFAK